MVCVISISLIPAGTRGQCEWRLLQGPILGCAFGYSIRDRNLFVNGFLNEIFALVGESFSMNSRELSGY